MTENTTAVVAIDMSQARLEATPVEHAITRHPLLPDADVYVVRGKPDPARCDGQGTEIEGSCLDVEAGMRVPEILLAPRRTTGLLAETAGPCWPLRAVAYVQGFFLLLAQELCIARWASRLFCGLQHVSRSFIVYRKGWLAARLFG
ncbi:hypothetical protein ACX9MO_13420 [Pseudooceanicola sp. 502str34]